MTPTVADRTPSESISWDLTYIYVLKIKVEWVVSVNEQKNPYRLMLMRYYALILKSGDVKIV